jgi:hypothetical protein
VARTGERAAGHAVAGVSLDTGSTGVVTGRGVVRRLTAAGRARAALARGEDHAQARAAGPVSGR